MAKPFISRPMIKIRSTLPFRQVTQSIVLLLTLGIGIQFFLYVNQAGKNDLVTITQPAGVEGFLPICALMGWKRFFLTGQWDLVHPAAMVILGFAALISFLFRKSFCAWFCPVGTLSEGLWRLGRFLFKKNFRIPKYGDGMLRLIKYALLGFFVWVIMTMSGEQIAEFMQSPYYQMADVKMLFFFTQMTRLTFVVLLSLIALSLLFKNFWCRYACPYGALMGFWGFFSPTCIRRHETKCTGCRRCDQICPSLLVIFDKTSIHSMECTGCMDCVVSCPSERGIGT
ncbi:MAG: 4Fe-4S binding protein [Desulfobacterium sp.]|nr:4Fe-4S binding protein [Desulfobacterium sp.]